MNEISILIGGKAGDGVKQAGNTLSRLLNRLGTKYFSMMIILVSYVEATIFP